MTKRPFKKEAVELRKVMRDAGFVISVAIDPSIELFLEKTTEQKALAGVEVTAKAHVNSGFLCLTQDYLIFAKRIPSMLIAFPDIFEIKHRPSLQGAWYPRMSLETKLFRFNGIPFHQGLSGNNLSAMHKIADYLTSGRAPNDPLPKVVPGKDGPSL